MTRCNPYGYATDAGPKHLAGGRFGPEYAGDSQLVRPDGMHGLGICKTPASGRWRMVCPSEHTGPIMDLCDYHVGWIRSHYTRSCTRCAMPEQSIQLEHDMESTMRSLSEAALNGDFVRAGILNAHLDDQRQAMDEMITSGVIRAAVPLQLVGVS